MKDTAVCTVITILQVMLNAFSSSGIYNVMHAAKKEQTERST